MCVSLRGKAVFVVNKQFVVFFAVGILVIGALLFFSFASTKKNHLVLNGRILKVRTGVIDEHTCAAVIDFRVENPSDVLFVVREVTSTLTEANGSSDDGMVISKMDFAQLLAYNKFLGKEYNEGLAIRDRIAPHATIDRMVAVEFPQPQSVVEKAKVLKLRVQDMDGPEWETEYRF